MSVIAPLTSPWAARKASSSWVSTSTRALPMPTTSRVAWSVTRGRLVGAATTDAAGCGWCQSWVACPSVPEQIPPPETLTPDVAAASTDANPHRLPRTVVPRRYDLTVERVLATTQMEATDARRAFPCWDEPDAKAVFGITLVVPGDLLAISNAAELDRTSVAGGTDGGVGVDKVAVRFADTMPMSTYLVAFVVGPLVATD